MAKIGLDFGEKLKIADKTYRVIDGLDIEAVLGKTTYRRTENPDVIYTDDPNESRRSDGSMPQVSTGAIRGSVLGIHSSVQHETLFVTIVDMSPSAIEELGLKFRDEVVLEGVVVTYSSVDGNSRYKIFASKIAKKGQGQPKQKEQVEHKENK